MDSVRGLARALTRFRSRNAITELNSVLGIRISCVRHPNEAMERANCALGGIRLTSCSENACVAQTEAEATSS